MCAFNQPKQAMPGMAIRPTGADTWTAARGGRDIEYRVSSKARAQRRNTPSAARGSVLGALLLAAARRASPRGQVCWPHLSNRLQPQELPTRVCLGSSSSARRCAVRSERSPTAWGHQRLGARQGNAGAGGWAWGERSRAFERRGRWRATWQLHVSPSEGASLAQGDRAMAARACAWKSWRCGALVRDC